MRKLVFVLAAAMFLLVSCDNYGKKVKINDTLEIFVKGDSVTENDAKRLGKYIADLSGDAKNEKSLQLLKDSGKYVVRMVVDKGKMNGDTALDSSFTALKTQIETEVFKGQPIKFTITDNRFNEIKSY